MQPLKYLTKIICLTIIFFVVFTSFGSTVKADDKYDVVLRVIDEYNAEIKITYPVPSGVSVISVLSSLKGEDILNGYRDLISANGEDGSTRTITDNTLTTDAHIVVLPADKKITITYKLSNVLNSNNISLFNFLLFFGTIYPSTAHVKLISPAEYEIISYSSGINTELSSDGEIIFDLKISQPQSLLSIRNLTVLIYPKVKSSYFRENINNFTLIGLKNNLDKISSHINKINLATEKLNELFGSSLKNKIVIVIIPTKEKKSEIIYAREGIALQPNIILIDPENFSFDRGPYDIEKTIIHELAHLAIFDKGIFSRQAYKARWFDEGLAVFGEQYFTDNYIIKNDNDRQIDSVLSSYIKMTLEELKNEYTLLFDYDLLINSQRQTITKSYAHSGLIIYNLYLKDEDLVKNILDLLKNSPSNLMCNRCDTETILNVIKNSSGLQKDEIIYPHKNNLDNNPIISRLTIKNIDEDTKKEIRQKLTDNIGSYIDKNAKTEEFNISNKKENTVKDSKISTSSDFKINKEDLVKNIDTKDIKEYNTKKSFFSKIKLWIISIFN